MEVHHEVYQEDPDWVELLVDEEHKKQLKVVSKLHVLSQDDFLFSRTYKWARNSKTKIFK